MISWGLRYFPGSGDRTAVTVIAGPPESERREVGRLVLDAGEIEDLRGRLAERDAPRGSVPSWQVTVDQDDLQTVLDQRTGHAHRVHGIWDPDNRPGLAGTRCKECAARDRLRAALDAANRAPAVASGTDSNPIEENR